MSVKESIGVCVHALWYAQAAWGSNTNTRLLALDYTKVLLAIKHITSKLTLKRSITVYTEFVHVV